MAAAIPFVIAAISVVSAVSAIRQGQAAQQSYAAIESANNFNASVAEQNTQIVRQQAQLEAQQNDRETFLRLGAIRAAQGKSGGAAGEGSVLDVLGDAAAQGKLESQNILYQGELQARGYTNTATLDRYSAQNAARSGKNAVQAGYMKAGSELLQGGSGAYTSYSRLNRG